MFEDMKYEVGTKVVVIGKTFGMHLGLSYHYRDAQAIGQPYLYVSGYEQDANTKQNLYVLNYKDNKSCNGDYFLEEDIISYEDQHSPEYFYNVMIGDKDV